MSARLTQHALIRLLRETELTEADHIFRLAFATFIGLPDPLTFMKGRQLIAPRWRTDPTGVLGAELDGQLIGSNVAANWGSFGFFGPLTIHPQYWDRGVATSLLAATMEIFREWGLRHIGLYTFANSPKHVGLYQKFGFWPRFLTAVMAKAPAAAHADAPFQTFSSLTPAQQDECLGACSAVSNSLLDGLDLRREIRAVFDQ